MDNDLEERELERLVFGNDAEFNNGITEFNRSVRSKLALSDEISDEDEVQQKIVLEDLDDADVHGQDLELPKRSLIAVIDIYGRHCRLPSSRPILRGNNKRR